MLLTANERDLVTRLLRCEKAPQIARETKRSVHTVRTTIRTIYGKLNVHSVSQLAEAVASGELVICTHMADSSEPAFNLSSALRVLQRERKRAKDRICSVKLHRNEIQELLVAGRTYELQAGTEGNLPSFIEPFERVVASTEAERSKIAATFAALLAFQDRAVGFTRATLQIDALAEVCTNTPFPLAEPARSEVRDAFRSSYRTPFGVPPQPGPLHDE